MQFDQSRLISSRSVLTGGVITIYVGPKRKEYQIHKVLLASCEYWRKFLDSKLPEDSQAMHLPEQDPNIWDLFVNWLYRGSLKDICVENEDMAETQVRQYIMLYSRAEQWAIPTLQNKIMDLWTTSDWDWSCDVDKIHSVYKRTLRDSPLRSYVVDGFLSLGLLLNADCENGERAALLKSQLDYGNQEFVLDCFEALMQLTPKSKLRAPYGKTGCTYHKHKDGEECSK